MRHFENFDPKPWDEALSYGLEGQDAIFRHLSRLQDCRVWKADEVEGRGAYRDSLGLPIPDLIKMEAGKDTTLVEVKSREEWWQRDGTEGPFETILEVRHIQEYAKVAQRYSTKVAMVFVVRIPLNGQRTKRGFVPRGPTGCWWSYIEDLVPLIEGGENRPLPKRGGYAVEGRGLRRIQDGGPLRPFAPWDEATKSVPVDPAAWAAWKAAEVGH